MSHLTLEKITKLLPTRALDSYKGDFGRVLLIGGNQYMGGAIQMAATSCIESGAGLVSVATDSLNFPAIHANLPEAMVCDWSDEPYLSQLIASNEIILIGPGLGKNKEVFNFLITCLKKGEGKLILMDADALEMVATELELDLWERHQLMVTPHPGEWKKLNPLNLPPNEWVDQYGVYLVLKSHETKVFTPKGKVYHNLGGNPGMAIGGSGDTLAGMIAGWLGQVSSIEAALCIAVFLHSYISDHIYQTHHIVRPTQIAQQISPTVKKLLKRKTHLKQV